MSEESDRALTGLETVSKPHNSFSDHLSAVVLRATSESVWLLDEDGRTLWTNEPLSILLGEPSEQLQSRNFFDFSADGAAEECFRLCQASHSEQRREMSFMKHGSIAHANARLLPFGQFDGGSSLVLAMITEVTRERQAEAAMLCAVQELERLGGDGSPAASHNNSPDHREPEVARESEPLGYRERLLSLATQIAESNQELEAFSYSVSHDLREPLRSIDGFSRIVLERYGPLLDDRGKDYLGRVRAAAQRMAQLIGDMLMLARIARAEMSLQPVNITQMARSVFSRLAESDPTRPVETSVSEDLAAVADPRLLNVVLENLLGNAWKFTSRRADARIEVTGYASETDEVFRVSDNGAGFEMKYVEKLFRPFQRLHTDADFAGSGVGLATVQRIVARHGGKVWAEGSVGQGTRFFFSIPRMGSGGKSTA